MAFRRRLRGRQLGEDQRLGGARPISPPSFCPNGFTRSAISAGFTQPIALAHADVGALFVAEAGCPGRTPPRIFAVDRDSGAASLLSTLALTIHGQPLALAVAGHDLLVETAAGAWRLDSEGALHLLPEGHAVSMEQRTLTTKQPTLLPFGPAVATDGCALFLCDPGEGDPGSGIIWQLTPRRAGAALGSISRGRPETRPRPRAPWLLAGGLLTLGAGAALALYCREHRGRC